ncbi:hypothetical protein EV178_005417 [Coemansia sp. RSA 1646]|nr:hypothetical protein EV178_005417 [Coemansia sp. RSA 1646]
MIALSAPIEKRDNGPVLALPGPGEDLGSFLYRFFHNLPLLGTLPEAIGLPKPK